MQLLNGDQKPACYLRWDRGGNTFTDAHAWVSAIFPVLEMSHDTDYDMIGWITCTHAWTETQTQSFGKYR